MRPDDLSLNEVESLARLAARGAGRDWGIADDVGRAARFLAAHGLEWSETLLALLETPPPPAADPLLLGCHAADGREAGRFARVVAPVWLLPPLLLSGADAALSLGGIAVAGNGAGRPWPEIAALAEAPVQLRFGPSPALPHRLIRATARPRLAASHAARLAALAGRTYVPASAQSRARGAGGGSVDDE